MAVKQAQDEIMQIELKEKERGEESKAARKKRAEDKEDEVYRRHHAVFRYHGKLQKRDKCSLYLCSGNWAVRGAFVWLVEWKVFDTVIITTILLNSLLLAFTDY